MTNSFQTRISKVRYKSNGLTLHKFPDKRVRTPQECNVNTWCEDAFQAGEPKVFFSAAYTTDGHIIYIYNKSEYTSSMEALNVLDILKGAVIAKFLED